MEQVAVAAAERPTTRHFSSAAGASVNGHDAYGCHAGATQTHGRPPKRAKPDPNSAAVKAVRAKTIAADELQEQPLANGYHPEAATQQGVQGGSSKKQRAAETTKLSGRRHKPALQPSRLRKSSGNETAQRQGHQPGPSKLTSAAVGASKQSAGLKHAAASAAQASVQPQQYSSRKRRLPARLRDGDSSSSSGDDADDEQDDSSSSGAEEEEKAQQAQQRQQRKRKPPAKLHDSSSSSDEAQESDRDGKQAAAGGPRHQKPRQRQQRQRKPPLRRQRGDSSSSSGEDAAQDSKPTKQQQQQRRTQQPQQHRQRSRRPPIRLQDSSSSSDEGEGQPGKQPQKQQRRRSRKSISNGSAGSTQHDTDVSDSDQGSSSQGDDSAGEQDSEVQPHADAALHSNRGRGQPKKQPTNKQQVHGKQQENLAGSGVKPGRGRSKKTDSAAAVKRGPGRPCTQQKQQQESAAAAKRCRGRPRKQQQQALSSSSESELKAAATATAPKPVSGNLGRVEQHKQRSPPPSKAARRHRNGSQRKRKGPLAAVLAAAAGPGGSSNTTATTSTRFGGANRPIPELTSYHQAVRRVNHQIQRLSTEEHLLQSYAADGWKGASREKVRLTDELKRAELAVARCKEVIRQAARYCEETHPGPGIPAAAVDSAGEVDTEDIFCAQCLQGTSTDDNDLVLCDGPCNRAYHECCLNPRLVIADIPEDEGWLCPACDAKMDILLQINDYYGTEYDIDTPWTELFVEAEEQQQATRMQRLRSCGSLESPRATGPAAAAAAAGQGRNRRSIVGAGLGLLIDGELLSTDQEDASYCSGSDADEVKGKRHSRKQQQRPGRSKCSRPGSGRKQAAAEVDKDGDGSSTSDGDDDEDGSSENGSGGDGGSSDDGSDSGRHTQSGDEQDGDGQPHQQRVAETEDDAVAAAGVGLRRSKRRCAADAVAAAAIAAGATPRTLAAAKTAAGAGRRKKLPAVVSPERKGRRRQQQALGSSSSNTSESSSSDEDDSSSEGKQQHQQRKRRHPASSTGHKHRRPVRAAKVDYRQLHEQLFGFAAFDGDDQVFKEQDDTDYQSDSDDCHSD